MAIAYKSAGAGVATETSGAACSPASPAVVDAGDILIVHAYFEGTADTPATPSGFTLLSGPHVIEATIGRHWIFGKIAAGTEDGAANALGTQAVTTMRSGRCYSFSGRVSGTITDLVQGFAATSHATDPQMPTVATTVAGARAVACVVQNDNNALGAATGSTGGTWTEAVAEFVAALTPGLVLQLQTCVPTADPGTVTGGAVAATNDPSGVIGFEIRPSAPAGVDATLTATVPDVTASSTAEADVEATASPTIGVVTAVATTTIEDPSVDATLAATVPPVTAAATAEADVAATAAPTVPPVTAAGAAAVDIDAAASATVPPVTSAAAAAVDIDAAGAAVVPPVTASATAGVDVDAQLGATVPAVTAAATAEATVDATASSTVPPVTAAATATIEDPGMTGTLAATVPDVTAVATATVEAGEVIVERRPKRRRKPIAIVRAMPRRR